MKEKTSNHDGILMNNDGILMNNDGILTNNDGILTLTLTFHIFNPGYYDILYVA